MERARFVCGCGLPVRALGRLGEVDLLGSNVDQDVLALMEPLEVSSVSLVHLATGPDDALGIEAHQLSPYHVPAQGWPMTSAYPSLHRPTRGLAGAEPAEALRDE
jgi:hypothetical protein